MSRKVDLINDFDIHTFHGCIDAYKTLEEDKYENPEEWLPCPRCNLKPRIWEFDNGRLTACGCWNDTYTHFTIYAESINSVYKRTGRIAEYILIKN